MSNEVGKWNFVTNLGIIFMSAIFRLSIWKLHSVVPI